MTDAALEIRPYEEAFNELTSQRRDGRWLKELRDGSFNAFAKRGFPTTREEDWKYTSLKDLVQQPFRLSETTRQPDAAEIDGLTFGLDAHRFVFLNGALSPALSSRPLDTNGVRVASLADTLHGERDGVGELLARYADMEAHRFAALNTAFVSDGAVIRLADDAVLDKPVYLLFASVAGDGPVVCHPRVLIDAGRRSQATIIEHFAAQAPAANFTNAVTEIVTRPGARIEHYKLLQDSAGGFHVGSVHAVQQQDSRFVNHNIALGGRLVRNDIHVRLDGPGASVVLNGLSIADGTQHIDNHTRIEHVKPHTQSEEEYRGVIDGRGRSVFNGKVIVHKDAQKTDAHQSNKNLLLSKTGEVDTKPELEIYADDVKCSHGATVGQLDRDKLFYLLSRGIDQNTARGLLTFAFADDVIARIQIPAIRHSLEALVIGRLPESERIKEFV